MRTIQLDQKQLQNLMNNQIKNGMGMMMMSKEIALKVPLNKQANAAEAVRIHFSSEAQLKIDALVAASKIEVAWHMVISKMDTLSYLVEDILVYPQIAQPTYVESNDAKYNDWLNSLDDDTFFKLRGQGHSHVHMNVGPSGTDIALYSDMLTQIKDHYLFMIVNKRGDTEFFFYDIERNMLYYKEDMIITSEADAWAYTQLNQHIIEKGVKKDGAKEKL